ncbi:MAG: ferrous iron transport protein A [Parvularculaceae bacterium]|uniref:FeoA family protein n=1 Tax=Methylocystis sp. TaxID=1911079 RepID=UPI003D0EFD19
MSISLDRLEKSRRARVLGLSCADAALEAKLREVGFAEDDEVEVMHFGPLGGKPICVRLNQTLIALRRNEAEGIDVEPLP